MITKGIFSVFMLVCMVSVVYSSQVPQEINYQGKVEVNGVTFDGVGQFKFAITNLAGGAYYWTNDGSHPSPPNEPEKSISLKVNQGVLSVHLGDIAHPNMEAIPLYVIQNPNAWLRIWFSDGKSPFVRLGQDVKLSNFIQNSKHVQSIRQTQRNKEIEKELNRIKKGNTVVNYHVYGLNNETKDVLNVPVGKAFIITEVLY